MCVYMCVYTYTYIGSEAMVLRLLHQGPPKPHGRLRCRNIYIYVFVYIYVCVYIYIYRQ